MVEKLWEFSVGRGEKILTFALRKPRLGKMSLRKIDLRKK